MRKRIIEDGSHNASPTGEDCLDLSRLAQVEVTSEDAAHPVEAALVPGNELGWRASASGEQVIRLLFDAPVQLRHIRLSFREETQARTQEFLLRYSADGGVSYRDIVRQQYTFSPPTTMLEVESYRVDLDGVTTLELRIVPNLSGGNAVASLTRLCVA